MRKPVLGYEFYFLQDFPNSYFFETDLGIKYEVKFKPFEYFFTTQDFAKNTFEFVIDLNYNPTNRRPPLDRRVSKSISDIFEDFYLKFSETITIYVCDSSDSRQLSRSRKFHIWFEEFHGERYFKYDTSLSDSTGEVFPISLIFRKNNRDRLKIIIEFDAIMEGYNSGK